MDRQTSYDALLASIPLPLIVGGALTVLSSKSAAGIGLCSALLACFLVGVGLFHRTPVR